MPPKKKTEIIEAPKEKKGGLLVYADFETFKAGDEFVIPEGWVHDTAYGELLFTKAKKRQGMVFSTPKGARVTLPVMEV